MQLAELGGLVQFGDVDLVPNGLHAGEVGLNPYSTEGGYDEERRRFEVDLITEELVQGISEVVVAALELPAEASFEVGIGKAAGHPLFEGEGVLVTVFDGGGVADEGADIQEHFLGRLLFAEVGGAPLGDEVAGVHAGEPRQAGCGVGGRFRCGHFKSRGHLMVLWIPAPAFARAGSARE